MPHTPDWHLLDNSFPDANAGIAVPTRTTSANGATLEITNLDRNDPPGYQPGGVPRDSTFNNNVFRLGPEPCMPVIPVVCNVSGFDPAAAPIQWRLVCRHVLCRHTNTGGYRYKGTSERLEREWRGDSRAASFSIFGPAAPECSCTYSDESRVLGGHALLMVAALVTAPRCSTTYTYVSAARSISAEDVYRYLAAQLAGYDENVLTMLRAIYAHESGFQQFAGRVQKQSAMTFNKRFHKEADQPIAG